jgi:hypothetical protein
VPPQHSETRTRWNDSKPLVVFFDVNETLIDIELNTHFAFARLSRFPGFEAETTASSVSS